MTTASLKSKLAILSAIPLLCAVGFGVFLTFERVHELREFKSFEEAMTLANLLAEVNEANNTELANAWVWTPTAIDENGVEVVSRMRETWEANGAAFDDKYEKMVAFRDTIDLAAYSKSLSTILAEVDESMEIIRAHRDELRGTMLYHNIIAPYVEMKTRIQAIYPALLQETSNKELSLKLTAYNLYLDYHSACVQYVGVLVWAHQVDPLPPGGYARYESYFRESETLLKHFRNLADPALVDQVDEILESERGRWVASKVDSFLTSDSEFTDFPQDKALENEFKSKAEGRNAELATIMHSLRADIMAYTAERIDSLASNRNATALITLLMVGFSIGFNFFFGAKISHMIVRITNGIAEGAAQVYSAARQITQASDTFAKSSCSQASSVEETTSMISHILVMTRATTENAKQARQMIQSTSSVIEESNQTMRDMNEAIQQIAANSEETKKIMGTINEIAFQTNILALNAAVEAARAGASGAGFAVVADEVRNLAQRSSAASDNTSSLIESSNQSIRSGTECAKRANQAFSKLLASAQEIFHRISEIDNDATKQADAITEISEAAQKVDQSTQSNAASAEECAASAISLNHQAEILDNYVHSLKQMVYGPAKADAMRLRKAKTGSAVEYFPPVRADCGDHAARASANRPAKRVTLF